MRIYEKKQFYFQGLDLVLERERLGLKQAEFAELAGWTQQNQSQLENLGTHFFTDEIKAGLENLHVSLEYKS